VPKIEMLSNRGQQSQSMDPSREIKPQSGNHLWSRNHECAAWCWWVPTPTAGR